MSGKPVVVHLLGYRCPGAAVAGDRAVFTKHTAGVTCGHCRRAAALRDEQERLDRERRAERLGCLLFSAVQAHQGRAHVSDAVEEMDDNSVVAVAVHSLHHTQETARVLRRFIARHRRVPVAGDPEAQP